jgi:NAD(P)-dependent dehydrogenase (short-subunit alcohol dehydrogenase family)
MGRFANQTVLITGGTSGIGLATAQAFAVEGAQVVITGRNIERGLRAVERIDGAATFMLCDVRDAEQCRWVVEQNLDRFKRIDVLFNNAGIVPRGTVLETSPQVWEETWQTNVTGTFTMCRLVLPPMIAQGQGVIVNNASDWGIVGGQNAAAYCATKGAVVLLTKAMALDHARQGVRVNAVCPGDTLVERWRSKYDSDSAFEQFLREDGEQFPLGRVGLVDEIAQAVLFLASSESSYITGQALIVDGGHTAGGTSIRYGMGD